MSNLFDLAKASTRRFACCLCLLSILLLTSTATFAQLPTPQLIGLSPAGGMLGSEFEVVVRGTHLDEPRELLFSHPGITAQLKPIPATEFVPESKSADTFIVKIAADVPVGIYESRLAGRFGVSNPRRFAVGVDQELKDNGQNLNFETALDVPLNSVVNGQTDANRADYYKLNLVKGETVVISCLSESIDSRADVMLVLFDEQHHEIDRWRTIDIRDCTAGFTPEMDGVCYLTVQDFIFTGGADYFYRLSVNRRPYLKFAFPVALPRNAESEVTLYGYQLPGGTPSGLTDSSGQVLEMLKTKIAVPATVDANQQTSRTEPLLTTLDWFDYRLQSDQGLSNPLPIFMAEGAVTLETEPNNSLEQPQQITVPVTVAGQFQPDRDVDCFEFTGKAGEVFVVQVMSQQFGLYTDPLLEIYQVTTENEKPVTKKLQTVDDPGDRQARIGQDFDRSTDDPVFRFVIPADGTYRLQIENQFTTGFSYPQASYELLIRTEKPDFQIIAAPYLQPIADGNRVLLSSLAIRKGQAVRLQVDIERIDGFAGDISVSVEGLPAGLTAKPVTASAAQPQVPLVIVANEDVARWQGPIQVVGKAKIGEQDVTRPARVGTVVWNTDNRQQNQPVYRTTPQLFLSVCDAEVAVIAADLSADQVYETSLGGKLEIPLKIARRNGFAGELKLNANGLPGQIKIAEVTIPADQTEAKLLIDIADRATPQNQFAFVLFGNATFKYIRNPDAIKAAEANQLMFDEKLKAATAKLAELNQQLAAAKTALDTLNNQVTAATTARQTAETEKNQQQQALDAKQKEFDAAKAAADAAPEDAALKEAVTVRTTELDAAKVNLEAGTKKFAEADTNLTTLQKQQTEADATFKQLTTDSQAEQQRVTQLTTLKQQADAALQQQQNANKEADAILPVFTNTVAIRVVASPIVLTAAAAQIDAKAASEAKLAATIERKYGFAGEIDLTIELPGGVTGITIPAAKVAADAVTGELTLTLAENATVGTHACKLVAKAKFNNVDVETKTDVTLVVAAAEPKPEENK